MSASTVTAAMHRVVARELFPHPSLDRAGVLPDLIARETKKGNGSGDNREDHKARALELDAEFAALVDDILLRGILEPLKVTKGLTNWLIADGRNRWEAARFLLDSDPLAERWHGRQALLEKRQKELSKGLPCIEIQEEDVPATILSAMTRRHMMKQARALMAVKIFPEVADAAAPGRKSLAHQGISQPSLAARVGVSLSIMEEVCRFWRKIKLDKTPAQQEDLINQVLAGISCDDALNGEKGRLATAGKPRPPTRTWSLMTRNANSLKDRWKDFVKLDDEDRKLDIIEKLSEALAAAPEDVKPALRAALEGGES